jgi:hypothetical protein
VVQTQAGGADVVVLPLQNFTIASGATLKLIGNRPVVLAVFGDATIAGTIDASASGTTPGAGGNAICSPGTGSNGGNGGLLGGSGDGGGGGGHATTGGTGDSGTGAGAARGTATLVPLIGGCPGGKGGNGGALLGNGTGGQGGAGGGAFQVSASGTVNLTGSVISNGGVGANGSSASNPGGGGGGGSGGGILLEGNAVQGAGALTVNGGNGGNRGGAASGGGAGGTTGAAGNGATNGGGGGSRGRTVFNAVAPCTINTASNCGTTCANAVNCDDGSPCSADSCVSGGCVHTPGNAGTLCGNQANICDAQDYCDGVSNTCPITYAAQGTDCGFTTGAVVIYQTGVPTNALDMNSSWGATSLTNAGPTTAWPDALKFTTTSAAGVAARFNYWRISTTGRTFLATDLIEYDVYLADSQVGIGGIDAITASGALRDPPMGPAADQNGLSSHPSNDISPRAFGKWYHRRFPLSGLGIVGKVSTKWDVVDENDNPSATYTAYYDNIIVAVKAGACDGANACKVKTGGACAVAGDCASGVCTSLVCN